MTPPSDADPARLVFELEQLVGDDLRAVGRIHDDEPADPPGDIETLHASGDGDGVVEDWPAPGPRRHWLEDASRAGALEGAMFKFEDAVVFHFVDARPTDLVVALEVDADIDIERLTRTCEKHR